MERDPEALSKIKPLVIVATFNRGLALIFTGNVTISNYPPTKLVFKDTSKFVCASVPEK
jgi:hypothetical protein